MHQTPNESEHSTSNSVADTGIEPKRENEPDEGVQAARDKLQSFVAGAHNKHAAEK